MAYTINRRLGQLIDTTGQLVTGKIPNDYITGDHIADNTITSSMLHTTFSVPAASLSGIDTDDVSEGLTNVYYTDARARGAISVSGSLSYDSGTGVVSYTTPTTIASLSNHTTTDLSEGTNLYYTTARFDTAFSGKSTTDLSEGTNLYYTDARVGSYLTANSYATQTYVSTAVSNLVDSAPATLDTLNELAAALGDDPNFATTVSTNIGTKVSKSGDTMTGNLTVPSLNATDVTYNGGTGDATTLSTTNFSSLLDAGSKAFQIIGGSLTAKNTSNNPWLEASDSGVNLYNGTNIYSGNLQVGGTTVLDTSRNLTNIGTISSDAITSSGNIIVNQGTPTGSVIGGVRAYGATNAYMGASDGQGRTAFFGVDTSGYAMFGALTNHDAVIRANNSEKLRVRTNSNVDIVSGALEIGSTTVVDSSRRFYVGGGSIQHSSRISFLNGSNGTTGSGAQGIAVESLYAGTSYTNTAPSGMVNALNGYQVGNTTVIDSTRRNIYLNSSNGGDGNGIFFRDGFTYNCSITVEDHNGNFADGLHISGYDGVSIGTGANTKSTDLLVDVFGNTTVYGNLNSVGGYKVNGTTIVDSSRAVSNVDLYALRTEFTAPYISPTNSNTLNAGLNWASDDADLWINYRGYQDGMTYFRDFRIGDGKNVGLLHVDGSAATINIGYNGRAVDLNLVSGSYSAGGSVVIDTSRSLLNLSGTIRSDSTFNFLTSVGGAQYGKFYGVSVSSTYSIGSYGGYFNAQNGYMVGNTTIVDSSRNLTNIGNITAAGKASLGDSSRYIGGMQTGALEIGSISRDYAYTSGWSTSMQAGILANCADDWEFVIHDASHALASAFAYYGDGAGVGYFEMGRDLGWGAAQYYFRNGIQVFGRSANWDGTTPGLAIGDVHLRPATPDNYGSAITWGASDASSGTTANAGIYIRSDGSYGTKMYIATTDSYATGSKTAITIDHAGIVTLNRNYLSLGDIRLNDSTSRRIFGETKNGNNSVTVTGNWDDFNIMGRVLDWTANNLHFGDGYNGVNHGSHYFQIGTGTGGLNYFRVGSDIYADGNVVAYYSDARLKQNIETIPNALEIIKGIRGVYFEWNKKSEEVWAKKEGEKDFGLISQEVEAVFPMGVVVQCGADKAKEMGYGDPDSPNYDPLHACDNEEEEYKTVKYDKMVAVAVQAINEQQKIIEQQQSQIDELKALIKELMEKP